MKIHNHSISRLLLVIFFVVSILPGCSQKQNKNTSEKFDEYTNQLFVDEITSNTINLHYTLAYPENYGIDNYTPTLGDFSIDELDQYTHTILPYIL